MYFSIWSVFLFFLWLPWSLLEEEMLRFCVKRSIHSSLAFPQDHQQTRYQGCCVKFHRNSLKSIKSNVSLYEQFSLKREKWICHLQEGLPTGTTCFRQHTCLIYWVLTWNSICWLSLMENLKCKIRNIYYKPWMLIFKNGYVCGQFYFVWTHLCFGFPSTLAFQVYLQREAHGWHPTHEF